MTAKPIKWAYGVTTCSARRITLLPKTLASLKEGGFDRPRLFVDGIQDPYAWELEFGLQVTARWPVIRTFGNWALSLAEVYIREPLADRYAIFQDDVLTYRNLRGYLEAIPIKPKTYWNLVVYPSNEKRGKDVRGFYESDQRGQGAQGLVFSRDAVLALMTHVNMVTRPMHPTKGWRNVDGGVVNSLRKAGYKELCHNPSLVFHAGEDSSMGNRRQPGTVGWMGEDFDALKLLPEGRL